MSLLIPKSFSTKTGSVQLSDLDTNFTYLTSTVNTALDITGTAVTVYGTLGASGAVTLANTLNVAGVTTLTNNLNVGGTVGATGAVTLASTLDVTGAATLRSASSTIPTGGRLSGTDVGSIRAPGTVVQTVYKRVDTRDTYAFATAGSLGTFIASLDTTITPKFSNSLIHVQMCLTYEVQHDTVFILYRDATQIGVNSLDANYWSGTWLPGYDVDSNSTPRTNHFFYMDTPATTAATTYRLMIQSGGVGATTFFLNRTIGSAGQASYEVAISQIILQEIAQ
jgi:hypothetical protein